MDKVRRRKARYKESQDVNIEIGVNSGPVKLHLEILLSIIQKKGEESASIKRLCVMVVSAMMVFSTGVGSILVLWAIVPIGVFWIIDVYYNSLESMYQKKYDDFVDRLHKGDVNVEEIYVIKQEVGVLKGMPSAMITPSVTGFYMIMFAVVFGLFKLIDMLYKLGLYGVF